MDAEDILTNVETKHERVSPYIRECANVFHDNEGELFTRAEATNLLTEEVDITEAIAGEVIAELVSDIVDPVVQIIDQGEKYIGVIEFREFDGAYGYIDYHDVRGDDKRVVCQQCVNEASFDTQVAHATAGDPSGTVASGADYDELLAVVHEHYENSHDVVPEDVETGATLASGTTIGGNTAYHTGNLADRGAVTITPSTTNQTIPEGFHNGNGFVEGDADLIADNIREGVDIFGVTGNIFVPPDSLIHRYRFEEDLTDFVGSHDGQENSGISFSTTSKEGNFSVEADGVSSQATFGSTAFNESKFSVLCWINIDNLTERGTILEDQKLTIEINDTIGGGVIRFYVRSGSSSNVIQADIPYTNDWFHLACAYDKESPVQQLMYINGDLAASANPSITPSVDDINLQLFGVDPVENTSFDGLLDLLDLYSRRLGSSEIINQLNTGSING